MEVCSANVSVRACPGCASGDVRIVDELNGWARAKCARCGLLYSRDVPTPGQIQQIYNQAYKPGGMYDILLRELQEMAQTGRSQQGFYRNRIFLRRYKPRPGDKLLDIGCGIGTFMVAAKQIGWNAEGI